MTVTVNPTVHILLATHQGARYLREQLESIKAQNYEAWTLTVSDDGSTDGTLEIIEVFASQQKDRVISVLRGPCQGVTANFFSLLNVAPSHKQSDLYAFCDQDDVWLPDKIERAVCLLGKSIHTQELPLLYCARTRLVDEQLRPIGLSRIPSRPLTFGNALTQNIASGNTMVFNRSLLTLLRKIPPIHSVWHDWTAYQVATACGGTLFYDETPALLYRQHASNVIGATDTMLLNVKRLRQVFKGRYRGWGEKSEAAMGSIESHMTLRTKQQLGGFRYMRRAKSPFQRLIARRRSDLYRQTVPEQVALLIALFFRLV
jgi:glycosyltransferase involved in cell wall biosynthesis